MWIKFNEGLINSDEFCGMGKYEKGPDHNYKYGIFFDSKDTFHKEQYATGEFFKTKQERDARYEELCALLTENSYEGRCLSYLGDQLEELNMNLLGIQRELTELKYK